MDAVELGICTGTFLACHVLFRLLNVRDRGARSSSAQGAQGAADAWKRSSCYLSHLHCAVTIVSCVGYWCTRPVDVLSPEFMVEGPPAVADKAWMRRTVAFSIGYFANDLVLILLYWPAVAGSDMIAHHLIIGGFFVLGLLDRCCTSYHFLFMIEELSTPFLNLRWQYRDQRGSSVYSVSQNLFAIFFFVSRILVGTFVVWVSGVRMLPAYIRAQPSVLRQVHLSAQLLACTLSRGLNFFWFWKIIKIALGGRHRKEHVNEDAIGIGNVKRD